MVEFAMVCLFLFIPMMMGIMEFGVLVKNNLLVANAVREGSRALATGSTTQAAQSRVSTFIAPMNVTQACSSARRSACGSMVMEFSTDSGASYQTVGNTTTTPITNTAPQGSLVRVTVNTRHRPLTTFFWFMNERNIVTTVTMRRE
jgi:Flp pilus assembly protein TadG